jgi:hypothetical protein
MAEGPYTPTRPDSAECPHCGAAVDGLPSVDRAARPAFYMIYAWCWCPSCERTWIEVRRLDDTQRFWELSEPPGRRWAPTTSQRPR